MRPLKRLVVAWLDGGWRPRRPIESIRHGRGKTTRDKLGDRLDATPGTADKSTALVCNCRLRMHRKRIFASIQDCSREGSAAPGSSADDETGFQTSLVACMSSYSCPICSADICHSGKTVSTGRRAGESEPDLFDERRVELSASKGLRRISRKLVQV